MRNSKIFIFLLFILLLFTTCASVYFYRLYIIEKGKVKNSLSPSLENDYYTKLKLQILPSNGQFELPSDIALNEQGGISSIENFSSHKNYLLDVPLVLQNPEFPNGCELAAAKMLLNYYGIQITIQDLVDIYLEKENVYEENGLRFGPDPSQKYAGDPRSTTRGWGTFAPYIRNLLEKIIKDKGKEDIFPIDLTGNNLSSIISDSFIQTNDPLLIWVGIDYQEADEVYMWYSADKKNIYTYPKNAHVVIITGQDENYYYVNNPLLNEKNQKIEKEILEKSYNSYGRQAIKFMPAAEVTHPSLIQNA